MRGGGEGWLDRGKKRKKEWKAEPHAEDITLKDAEGEDRDGR